MVEGRTESLELIDIPGVPEDTRYLGDRLDRIAAYLEQLAEETTRRERPAPMLINIGPGKTYMTTVRLRVYSLITSGAAASFMRLTNGAASAFEWYQSADGAPVAIPLEITIEQGVGVNVTDVTAGGTDWTAYLLAYPDGA